MANTGFIALTALDNAPLSLQALFITAVRRSPTSTATIVSTLKSDFAVKEPVATVNAMIEAAIAPFAPTPP